MGDIYTDPSLTIEVSRDFKVIKDLIFHEDIKYGLLSKNIDDLNIENFDLEKKLDCIHIIYYIMKINEENAGLCAFMNLFQSDIEDRHYLCDFSLLKKFRGKLGYKLAKIALYKFLKEVEPKKIILLIKLDNKKSLYFALRTGFKIFKKDELHYFLEVKNGWLS